MKENTYIFEFTQEQIHQLKWSIMLSNPRGIGSLTPELRDVFKQLNETTENE